MKRFRFVNDDTIATIEIDLKNNNFSCSGTLKNKYYECGGQCLDEILQAFPDNAEIKILHTLWKKYHLNDMHAGTYEQEQALEKAVNDGVLTSYGANNYKETCDYLKSIGLYEVIYNGKPYKYGTGWLTFDIPKHDLDVIKMLMA